MSPDQKYGHDVPVRTTAALVAAGFCAATILWGLLFAVYSRLETPGTWLNSAEMEYRQALTIAALQGSYSLFGSGDEGGAALGPVRGIVTELPTTATFRLLMKWSDADLASGQMRLRDPNPDDMPISESQKRFRELNEAQMADTANGLVVEASEAASFIALIAGARAEGGWVDDRAVRAGLFALHKKALRRAVLAPVALAHPGLRVKCSLAGGAGCPDPINPELLEPWIEGGGLSR